MAWDIRRGKWTEPELAVIPWALKPGEAAVDVGANFGLWTYHLCRAVEPDGHVFAFEPIPWTYSTLRKVAWLLRFRNAELYRLGCSDREGVAEFATPTQESGAVAAGLAYLRDARGNWGKENDLAHPAMWTKVVAIDDVVPIGAPVALIKCDIEGAELFALQGAAGLISRCVPTVVCEMAPGLLGRYGVAVDDVMEFFYDKGYSMYHYESPRRGRLRRVTSTIGIEWMNFVFLHESREERFAGVLE
ncbi:MAG: FkbM family methyltransferase [Actinomycetota bacterium]|nr:FkbM family methyltransferase [Actinomycetota bacterium]